jgi:hypothetical protein
VTNVSRTGGLEMWSNPRWISDQELKKFQNDVPSTTIWFMVQTAITDATNKFSDLNCRHAMAWRHQ